MVLSVKNLALIGPPGSGKGSYGRHLAKALKIPLVSMSDMLREQLPDLNLGDGKLIDDRVVSNALLKSLKAKKADGADAEDAASGGGTGYLIDGFPRTLKQIQVMEDDFPPEHQIQAMLMLNVPDRVCKTKLLGRRFCNVCNVNFSINGVDFDDFLLPPSTPQSCRHPCSEEDWTVREDDAEDVVDERLQIYHEHMDPIVRHFQKKNALLRLTPYKGYDDIPLLLDMVQDWLKDPRLADCGARPR